MVLSNQDLWTKISGLVEEKFKLVAEQQLDELVNQKIAEKCDTIDARKLKEEIHTEVKNELAELSNEITRLREQNERLLQSNNTLLAQNEHFRKSIDDIQSCDSGKQHIVDDPEDFDGADDVSLPRVDEDDVVFEEDNREYVDCLILSDSIYRHVGKVIPQKRTLAPLKDSFTIGNVRIMKFVVPGARCDRLWAEAANLNKDYSFGQLILSVGTNYVPSTHAQFRQNYQRPFNQRPFNLAKIPPAKRRDFLIKNARDDIRWNETSSITPVTDVIADITSLIRRIGYLFDCDVSFSAILPQKDLSCIRGIADINSALLDFCKGNRYGFIQHPQFMISNSKVDFSLFAIDGVHLRTKGIDILFSNLKVFIENEFEF